MRKQPVWAKPALLFAASTALLLASTVGSTRAALTYYSDNYALEMTVAQSMGVSLTENGRIVSHRDYDGSAWNGDGSGTLLEGILDEGEKLIPGKSYEEAIGVSNSGSIDSYVRVILQRSWLNPEGGKDTSLSPDLISLNVNAGSGWVEDARSSTPERMVFYYTRPLPSGQSTPLLCDSLKIDPAVMKEVLEETVSDGEGRQVITTSYAYDGYRFCLEAEVDAVQTHNAEDAVKSAWGVDVTVAEDGSLSIP